MKNLLALILIGLVIMCFSRCSSAKELLDKAEKKDPAIVAEYARQKYPCTDLLRPDTVTLYEDSLVFIECPEEGASPGDYATVRRDTLRLPGEVRRVQVPVKILVPSKVITQWFEDSAKLKLAAIEAGALKSELSKAQADRDKYKARSDRRGKENWIWRALATLFIGLWVWRKYKQLTTIKIR